MSGVLISPVTETVSQRYMDFCMRHFLTFLIVTSSLMTVAPGMASSNEDIPLPMETLGAADATTADQVPAPKEDLHLGVASCAGSNCHGAARPYQNSSVVQNEYTIWNREDPHSKSYAVLLNDRSKRIARNLGLPKPPEASKICLDCHADNVPVSLRGKRFDINDGVGCEACHGGGNRYLGPHVSGEVTHQQNLDLGLYPTEKPEERAQLCIQCHVGDQERFAIHKIMGAGHPRISFELDTFTEVHKHYVMDTDYLKRKGVYSHVNTWAIGQIKAARRFIDLYNNGKHSHRGLMPELSFFDCEACHHETLVPSDPLRESHPSGKGDSATSKLLWEPRALSSNIGSGAVRFNDSGFVMTAILGELIAHDRGDQMRSAIMTLHKASQVDQPSLQQALKTIDHQLESLETDLLHHTYTVDDCHQLLRLLISRSRQNDFYSYAAAEQAVMAIEAIRATLEQQGDRSITDNSMNALRNATQNPDGFHPALFRGAMATLGSP